MNVIELPVPRATDLPVWTDPSARMARSLVTQYWRRSHLLPRSGARPPAIAVFDDAIVQALAGLKQHLAYAPEVLPTCREAIAAAGDETLHEPSRIFALACLEVLQLQLGRAGAELAHLGGEYLQAQPVAVCNALRFAFDGTVGAYLAPRVALLAGQQGAERTPLGRLLLRLAIARPAVSDAFAEAVAPWVASLPGGMAVLCAWRCTGRGDEARALAAVEQGDDAEAALAALALMGSLHETPAARAVLARNPRSPAALALLAAREGYELAVALREGRHPEMPWAFQCQAASLVGDVPLLRHLAAHAPWDDEEACRTLADAVALLTGTPADGLFDLARPALERASAADAALAALPLEGPALRLGRARSQVVLEDSTALVGAPLRHLLHLEHASRLAGALWIEADDLMPVQGLAAATASVLERAAFGAAQPQP
ncbi:hypothetical protein [Paracidovorax avenae]|uniref:hypothetical protein n=1 Tax=Paracidovorax avenae TaxID=80867 RepID=UPI000D206F72|nr:hypothetical protein [Paracidovorax avenae]AVS96490.1 hypothetical protein C8232_09665 [Paracidovorax avenae]AVT03492.1 hypothetical protein C8243_14030 [Paracidovorax avenae]AVT10307.1 hypothetical protein C8242_13065 [Paracidovorax avenae]